MRSASSCGTCAVCRCATAAVRQWGATKPLAMSKSATACSTPKRPTRSRRSIVRCAPTPSCSPRSRAMARIYVPLPQRTRNVTSLISESSDAWVTLMSSMRTGRDFFSTSACKAASSSLDSSRRARSYSRSPATFSAEKRGGICTTSPTCRRRAASIWGSVSVASCSAVATVSCL